MTNKLFSIIALILIDRPYNLFYTLEFTPGISNSFGKCHVTAKYMYVQFAVAWLRVRVKILQRNPREQKSQPACDFVVCTQGTQSTFTDKLRSNFLPRSLPRKSLPVDHDKRKKRKY